MSSENQNWQNNQTNRPGNAVLTDNPRNDRIVEVASPNRDPLTGEPGSHPVGVGAGTTAGVLTGAAIGSLGGPIGTAIGAIVGGIAGAGVGKGVAESVNPTNELEYWKSTYPSRPYATAGTFDDYEPAYRAVIDREPASLVATRFEDAEAGYRQTYERNRGTSKLDWSVAKQASRDAWERLAPTNVRPATAVRTERDEVAAAELKDLVQILNDGSKGFAAAAEKLENLVYRDATLRFSAQRRRFATELNYQIGARGEEPTSGGDLSGAMHRAWLGLRSALGGGDSAIISECEFGEDAAVAAYEKAMNNAKIPADARQMIVRQYADVLAAHNQIRDWKHAFQGA